jgi:uncharacterized membrane protein YgcG
MASGRDEDTEQNAAQALLAFGSGLGRDDEDDEDGEDGEDGEHDRENDEGLFVHAEEETTTCTASKVVTVLLIKGDDKTKLSFYATDIPTKSGGLLGPQRAVLVPTLTNRKQMELATTVVVFPACVILSSRQQVFFVRPGAKEVEVLPSEKVEATVKLASTAEWERALKVGKMENIVNLINDTPMWMDAIENAKTPTVLGKRERKQPLSFAKEQAAQAIKGRTKRKKVGPKGNGSRGKGKGKGKGGGDKGKGGGDKGKGGGKGGSGSDRGARGDTLLQGGKEEKATDKGDEHAGTSHDHENEEDMDTPPSEIEVLEAAAARAGVFVKFAHKLHTPAIEFQRNFMVAQAAALTNTQGGTAPRSLWPQSSPPLPPELVSAVKVTDYSIDDLKFMAKNPASAKECVDAVRKSGKLNAMQLMRFQRAVDWYAPV